MKDFLLFCNDERDVKLMLMVIVKEFENKFQVKLVLPLYNLKTPKPNLGCNYIPKSPNYLVMQLLKKVATLHLVAENMGLGGYLWSEAQRDPISNLEVYISSFFLNVFNS
jgi:hypothetical protein